MKKILAIMMIALFFGALGGIAGTYTFMNVVKPSFSQEQLIAEYYASEDAVHISPHSIRKGLDSGDTSFILVDLRSQEEYEREHIISAVNLPTYKDPDNSAYDETERIISSFEKLKAENPGRNIITYCYSTPCMTGRKIGNLLAQNNIYVQTLNIGWNDWRYYWTLWNHEHEWDKTNVMDYIATGSEPGTPKIRDDIYNCGIEGALGC